MLMIISRGITVYRHIKNLTYIRHNKIWHCSAKCVHFCFRNQSIRYLPLRQMSSLFLSLFSTHKKTLWIKGYHIDKEVKFKNHCKCRKLWQSAEQSNGYSLYQLLLALNEMLGNVYCELYIQLVGEDTELLDFYHYDDA